MPTGAWRPWLHEARRCGRGALTLPLLAAVAAWAATATGPEGGGLLARALITTAVPAATALACASVVAREPMAELHLTLPTSYPRTVARRLCWPAGATAVAAVVLAAALTTADRPFATAALLAELAGLTALLTGCAVWATVRAGSAGAGAGLVTAVCLAKLLLIDRIAPHGAPQGLPASMTGLALTALTLQALGDAERSGVLTRDHQEG
ncbi:hypothetical protein [Streptomyces swartbergensis]|uniref:ABC transporter n=1 Tax=Streptomyces swartbergensis TaxID=487165 RepID=A0A243RWI0_9ACTN|nr:hypothetical protein [Streptomyces swartbergensis]OUC99540.1 hypothetical protein CA983_27820 [Streptomyces swartbergensis]